MTQIGADLAEKARRVVIAQLLVTIVVAAVFFLFSAGLFGTDAEQNAAWEALSAAYGGLTSVVLALISISGFKRANAIALSDPKQSMMILYIGAVVRFAAVIVLLAAGVGDHQGVLADRPHGFVVAQASYLMSVRDRKAARNSD